jgi:DNA-binding CsgD family transcriptional regulator
MDLSPATEQALESCYDAIATPGLWPSALDDLAYSIGATACMILPHEVADRQFGIVYSNGMRRNNEIHQQNLDWVTPVYEPRGDPYVRRGYQALVQSQLFTEEEIRHSRFHQEIARPAGTLQWACGIFSADSRNWCMPFFRANEPFASDILEPIAEISRRVARIVSISDKVSRSSTEQQIRTLELTGCAALLIDRHGRVGQINRLAEELFCSEFGVRNGRLWTAASASLARLDRFLAALKHASITGKQFPDPVIIARDCAPWLLIEAMPVTAASIEIFDGSRAVLIMTDLTHPPIADEAVLGLVFGLTKAEARLAAAICEGREITAIAATLGVSHLTLRGYLKTIFAKTGSRRQAELVARVAQIKHAFQH